MSYNTAHGSQHSTSGHHVTPNPRPAKQAKITSQHRSAAGVEEARRSAITVDLTEEDQDNTPSTSQDTQRSEAQTRNNQSFAGNAQTTSAKSPNFVPFPRRPGSRTAEELAQEEAQIEKLLSAANERKPGSLDTPPEAYRYPGGKCADFNPWIGGHQEDVLSEQTIKGGFSNKPAVTNETNTAKPSLWAHLKSKQGAGALSSLFVAVLEKRQAAGRVTSPSTFKLPPRVTLTGTRREAWLGDLANTAVPLRKLSRTIPHGVNGKVLLEQCLGKNIPAPRAIWLIKCVGANELRAFKRKGAAGVSGATGEAKWTRDWTCHVEQFIESILSNCGEAGWSEKIQYVIRLAVTIFTERLLDQDHYLAWILESLKQSGTEHLPFWIIMSQIHWRHIVATRKHGKRLAETLLLQLKALSESPMPSVYAALMTRLRNLLLTLAVAHKGCLLSPSLWQQFSQLMPPTSLPSQNAVASSITDLSQRNTRLDPSSFHKRLLCTTSRHQIFQLLDSVGLNVNVNEVVSQCQSFAGNPNGLCKMLLEWGSSIYRTGTHRVYLITRLLRRCRSLHAGLEDVVFDLASDSKMGSDFDFDSIVRIIAELVRSDHFSVARFLQLWIASGIGQRRASVAGTTVDSDAISRLSYILRNVPLDNLPGHVGNLAEILLATAASQKPQHSGASKEDFQAILTYVQRVDTQSIVKLPDMSCLTASQRHTISRVMRSYIQSRLKSVCKPDGTKQAVISTANTEALLLNARAILEGIGDYPIIADIVGMLSLNADPDLLASLADTLNMHHTIFACIGALRPLLTALRDRYQMLRQIEGCGPETIRALLKLTEVLEIQNTFTQQLKVDLARREQRSAVAMCSPASDNVTEHLPNIDASPEDEIERILASGSTMDQPNMVRVFKRLASFALDRYAKPTSTDDLLRVAGWLTRLQTFDRACFEALMISWVKQLLASNGRMMMSLLTYIIGAECIKITTLLQAVDVVAVNFAPQQATELNLDVLEYLFMLEAKSHEAAMANNKVSTVNISPMQQKLHYRARLESKHYMDVSAEALLIRLATVSKSCISDNLLQHRLQHVVDSETCQALLMNFLIDESERLSSLLHDEKTTPVASLFTTLLSGDRGRRRSQGSMQQRPELPDHTKGEASPTSQLPELLMGADELSLCFSSARIHCMFAGTQVSNNVDTFARDYLAQLPSLMKGQCPVWANLLVSLRRELRRGVQQLAAERLAQVSCPTADKTSANDLNLLSVEDLLSVIDCCYDATRPEGDASSRFTAYTRAMINGANSLPNFTERDQKGRALQQLGAGIHLTIMYPPPSITAALTDERTQCIVSFAALLRSDLSRDQPALLQQIFDLLAILSDDITEEQRLHILRNDAVNASDPRIKFILGSLPSADTWLGLVTSATNGTLAGPTTPSATAAMPSPVAITAQRSLQQARRPPGQPPAPNPHLPPRPGTPIQRTNSGLLGQQQASHHHPAHQKVFNPPVPYMLRRWEILPDQGANLGNTSGQGGIQPIVNDTSIGLSLFGARRVV